MRHQFGTPRTQSTLFPSCVEDYVPQDHPVRVIDAFVDSMDVAALGFEKAIPASTGRKPYHPGDLLKLYIYAYLNQTSSSRRLEKECHRNIEVMWLMKQLKPDFKTIANFRKDNGTAIKGVCRQFIVFCKEAGLVNGHVVAIDGSKFKAVASKDQAVTRKQLEKQLGKLDQRIERYLKKLSDADQEENTELDGTKVAGALAYLQSHKKEVQAQLSAMVSEGKTQICHTEPDAKLMKSGRDGMVVGYNAQNAVDGQHQLVVYHELTQAPSDNQQLKPIVNTSNEVLAGEIDIVLADAGYSNGKQVSELQNEGVDIALPVNRSINNQGHGQHFQKNDFTYLPDDDAYRCPAGEILSHKTFNTKDRMHLYSRSGCSACSLQEKCTKADRRWVTRHFDEEALNRANQCATPERMVKRMAIVEPTFATLKRLLNKGRFTCWGLKSAASEYSLGVLSYNLMRAINILGVSNLIARIQAAK